MAAAPAVTTFSRATGEVGTLADDEAPLALARTRRWPFVALGGLVGAGLALFLLVRPSHAPRQRAATGAACRRAPGRPRAGGACAAATSARGMAPPPVASPCLMLALRRLRRQPRSRAESGQPPHQAQLGRRPPPSRHLRRRSTGARSARREARKTSGSFTSRRCRRCCTRKDRRRSTGRCHHKSDRSRRCFRIADNRRRPRRCRSSGTGRCPGHIPSRDRCPKRRESTCPRDWPDCTTRTGHRRRSRSTPHPRRSQRHRRSRWNRTVPFFALQLPLAPHACPSAQLPVISVPAAAWLQVPSWPATAHDWHTSRTGRNRAAHAVHAEARGAACRRGGSAPLAIAEAGHFVLPGLALVRTIVRARPKSTITPRWLSNAMAAEVSEVGPWTDRAGTRLHLGIQLPGLDGRRGSRRIVAFGATTCRRRRLS
jgi:hypothetical protein